MRLEVLDNPAGHITVLSQSPSNHGFLDAENEAVLSVQGSADGAVGALSCQGFGAGLRRSQAAPRYPD